MRRPTTADRPSLLCYVKHEQGVVSVQGVGSSQVVAEVLGTHYPRTPGHGWVFAISQLPAVIGSARARGGRVTVAHLDGSMCEHIDVEIE